LGDYQNNIDADPDFCDYDTLIYFLTDVSPCLTAGSTGNYIGAFDWGCYVKIPESSSLQNCLQIYPNPTNNGFMTMIVQASEYCEVRVEIYNLLGEKIMIPVMTMLGAGEHQVYFDIGELPVGTYVCRMTCGKQVMTSRLIKVR
jgi:hypothetical protein